MHITKSIYLILCVFAHIYRRLGVNKLAFSVFLFGYLSAQNLYVFGTYDFNQNGRSEIITLNGLGTSLDFIELNKDGSHNKIWTYNPQQDSGSILDAKLSDLNGDDFPELVIIESNNFENSWIKIFEWNGFDFSLNKNPITNGDDSQDKIRPSNLSNISNVFALSKSSPTRSVKLFNLKIDNGIGQISDSKEHTNSLVTNGYGPVFSGLFETNAGNFGVLISPESNVLKASVFSVENPGLSIISDLIVTNGARVILGPYLQPFDENKDGSQGLLIPFATGEVYLLSVVGDSLSFVESKLSQKGLFNMTEKAKEDDINDMILSRVELGLYDNSQLNFDVSFLEDSLLLLVSDTLMLGDTLNRMVIPNKNNVLYSFHWESTPPVGMIFNPNTNSIEWIPKRDDIGVVDFSYKVDLRVEEEIVSGIDSLGDTHQLYPVLETIIDSTVLLVGDTTKIPEPLIIIPTMFHGVSVTSKDIPDSNKFTFEGEAPFSTNTTNRNGLVTVGVSADLGTIKQNKAGSFIFKSSQKKPESLVTLSLIHDLSTNIFYATISEPQDTLNQSFDPEAWQPSLYEFPEYYFEGFPSTMALDTLVSGKLSLLSTNEKKSGTISLYSPLFAKDHSIEFSYFGGHPYAIRGNINVKEDGSHKTLTEVDFESSFIPLNISSMLMHANRDTFVFAADSVPDTLETSINYRSFYSPVTIVKELATQEPGVSSAADTVGAPVTPKTEPAKAVEKNIVDPDTIKLQNDPLVSLPDSLKENPVDTIGTDIDTTSIITTPELLTPPVPADSIKTPSVEMPADSTK